jgi:hypothetical protein
LCFSSGFGLGLLLIKDCHRVNVDYHLLQKQQVMKDNRRKKNVCIFSWIIVAIPTAIAAFYLPVTLMCLLYFRIYRETVKRRKELHLLQAQHHTKTSSPPIVNTSSNGRLTKTVSAPGTTSAMDRDETMSTDSNRSHGKIMSVQNSSANKLILSNKRQKKQSNHTLNCCCYRR